MAEEIKLSKEEKEELLKTMRDRFKLMKDADQDNLREALVDMEFINVPGEQWDQLTKQERGDRPCYEFNKLRINAKRIINHIRTNRPAGKIRGIEGTDKKQAEYREGIIRNIWNTSDGDTIIDQAAEYQVGAGMGAWRIITDYVDDNVFDQDIMVEAIHNPFCLFHDPSAKDMMKRDAADWILTDKISRDQFKAKYPEAEMVDFESHEFDDEDEWQDEDEVRIAEYWYKEPLTKEIWQLQDGKVIDSEEDEAKIIESQTPDMIKKRRTVGTHKILMFIASGTEILEGPTEWAGSIHPFVKVYGEHMIVDGKLYWFGIGRFAKDAQRSYNVSRTSITETIAMAPQSKFWATVAQAGGNIDQWAEAHKKLYPFQLYTPDSKAPGPPVRMGGADVPLALMNESQLASQEIDDVTGIFGDDRGQSSDSQSGRAIYARQEQGQVVTYNYPDNMAKGIQRTWEILLDLFPKIYDTEREMRVLGTDGEEDYVTINTFVQGEDGERIKVNDMGVGRFDVTVTTGPSFSSKRQEAAETYQMLTQGNPDIFPLIGDLIFKSLDLPYAEDIAERLKTMLPPQIQEMLNKDSQVPPEIQQMMQQTEQAMAMVEEQAQVVQQQAQEADISKAESEKLIADVKTEQANFKAYIAQQLANIAQKDAGLTAKSIEQQREGIMEEGQNLVEGERQQFNAQLAQEIAQSVAAIQEMAAQFNEFAVGTVKEIEEREKCEPKIVKITSQRVNGKLEAIPVYEEESIDKTNQ